jgi:hypothetical protein
MKQVVKRLEHIDREPEHCPGGSVAVQRGCICPVTENNHGRGNPIYETRNWWVSERCEYHHDWR